MVLCDHGINHAGERHGCDGCCKAVVRQYDVGAVTQEVTNETQLVEMENLIREIRLKPEVGYDNLKKLDAVVERLLATWNNPPRA